MASAPRVLGHRINVYSSVEINDERLEGGRRDPVLDPVEFERDLWHSLRVWKQQRRKGVWLKLPLHAADLVPVAVRAGFVYHHAEPECLILSAWLDKDSENKLPPGPSFFIGVAGFVLNSKNQVLCVKEKTGPSARLEGFWKLPGGLVDKQEDIRDAVVREVKEETGLDAEFSKLATIQEIHHTAKYGGPAREGTTDLYCICILKAKDETQALIPQETEIAECAWVPLEEFLNSRYYRAEGTVYHKMFRVAAETALGHSDGFESESLRFGFSEATQQLYSTRWKNSKL